MPNLPFDPVSLIFVFVTIFTLLLYLHEHNLREKAEKSGESFLQDIQEKGWETLNQSIKKSQAIIGEAEIEGIKETAKIELDFQKKLTQSLDQSKQTIVAAQNQLLKFMQDLKIRSQEFEEASKASGEARINQLFDRVENRLSDFLMQTEQKTTSSIELELKSARELVEAYKSEQLKLIDENIIAMMEQTLSLVLGKKLSLKDQLDLIYEALEKAKVEKFIV